MCPICSYESNMKCWYKRRNTKFSTKKHFYCASSKTVSDGKVKFTYSRPRYKTTYTILKATPQPVKRYWNLMAEIYLYTYQMEHDTTSLIWRHQLLHRYINLESCCSEQARSVLGAETISLRIHKTFSNDHHIITPPVTNKIGRVFNVTIAKQCQWIILTEWQCGRSLCKELINPTCCYAVPFFFSVRYTKVNHFFMFFFIWRTLATWYQRTHFNPESFLKYRSWKLMPHVCHSLSNETSQGLGCFWDKNRVRIFNPKYECCTPHQIQLRAFSLPYNTVKLRGGTHTHEHRAVSRS